MYHSNIMAKKIKSIGFKWKDWGHTILQKKYEYRFQMAPSQNVEKYAILTLNVDTNMYG